MSTGVKIILAIALILSIGIPFGSFIAGEKTKGRYKRAMLLNIVMFFGTIATAVFMMGTGQAYAAAPEAAEAAATVSATGMGYISAALASAEESPFRQQHQQPSVQYQRTDQYSVSHLSS